MPRPTSQDLAGYWDMLQLSVEDVSMKFDELHQLKLNDWKMAESPDRKVPAPRGPPPLTGLCGLPLPGSAACAHVRVCVCMHTCERVFVHACTCKLGQDSSQSSLSCRASGMRAIWGRH